MVKFLLAPLIVFAVLAGWVWVQWLYARFATANPQLGPFRREDGGCSCGSGQCKQPSSDRIKVVSGKISNRIKAPNGQDEQDFAGFTGHKPQLFSSCQS